MVYKPSLLVTQSFVVSGVGTYWDYRDYIFCLCSNPSIKDAVFRLNIERGTEFAGEFSSAAAAQGFLNTRVTTITPPSWADYMLEQIEANPARWVMPWPGDHIYVHPDDSAFVRALEKGEELGADAVLYGHMQDFEYYLDWDRINILYNDPEYVMIEWGRRYRYRQNKKFQAATKTILTADFYMIPVPAFAVYRKEIFIDILKSLPKKTVRWQDMENSPAKSARRFKLLIPKQCLYRHVHGYWLEGFLKYYQKGPFPKDTKAEMLTWYVRTNYDWKNNSPTRHEYREASLKVWPYFEKYFRPRNGSADQNQFGFTPFDVNWHAPKKILFRIRVLFQNNLLEPLKLALVWLLKSTLSAFKR